jgi:hypothetical protein
VVIPETKALLADPRLNPTERAQCRKRLDLLDNEPLLRRIVARFCTYPSGVVDSQLIGLGLRTGRN